MKLYDVFHFVSHPIAIVIYFLSTIILFPHTMELFSQLKKRPPCIEIEKTIFDNPNSSFTFNKIKIISFCLLTSFLILFSSRQFVILLGCNDIRVMPTGTYCYYVLATNSKDKTYTLPAKIEKEGSLCYVRNVYFKNGGYLYFEEGELSEHSKTNIISCNTYDQNSKDWKIELTQNKTTHSKVTETDPRNPFRLIFAFCHSSFFLICAILNVWHWFKRRNDPPY